MALLGDGSVLPVIDQRYSLDQAAEALRRISEGDAHGKLLIISH